METISERGERREREKEKRVVDPRRGTSMRPRHSLCVDSSIELRLWSQWDWLRPLLRVMAALRERSGKRKAISRNNTQWADKVLIFSPHVLILLLSLSHTHTHARTHTHILCSSSYQSGCGGTVHRTQSTGA